MWKNRRPLNLIGANGTNRFSVHGKRFLDSLRFARNDRKERSLEMTRRSASLKMTGKEAKKQPGEGLL